MTTGAHSSPHSSPHSSTAIGRRWRTAFGISVVTLTFWLGLPARSDAANDALIKLLEVLRDRGSITAAEYEAIRQVAESTAEPVAAPAAGRSGAPTTQAAAAAAAPTTPPAPTAVAAAAGDAKATTDIVNRTLAGKWYEKLGMRGYTQLRYSEVLSHDGPPIDVPADRSANENETFILRRGRLVLSGDPTQHLAVYAQMDFNGSTGAADYSLQMRDLYADIAFDHNKAWRVRVGQSKVPFGFVNMQSSQNRGPFERPDALNSAVEGERDLGASLMWASPEARKRFRDLTGLGLKGSGDYGVVAVGAYSGQGLNRPDQNGDPHVFARVSYPFKLASGQYVEVGVQGYTGKFLSPVQAITSGGVTFTPSESAKGTTDRRMAATFVWYPQPIGLETEWTWGRGPTLSRDFRTIDVDDVQGGYVQLHYLYRNAHTGTWFPFARWNYYDGGRKFARNAPREKINELDFGLEFAKWAEVEVTGQFTHTFERTRTSTFPYLPTRAGNRVGLQLQWNY